MGEHWENKVTALFLVIIKSINRSIFSVILFAQIAIVEHASAGVSGHHGAEIEYVFTDLEQVVYMHGYVVYVCVCR